MSWHWKWGSRWGRCGPFSGAVCACSEDENGVQTQPAQLRASRRFAAPRGATPANGANSPLSSIPGFVESSTRRSRTRSCRNSADPPHPRSAHSGRQRVGLHGPGSKHHRTSGHRGASKNPRRRKTSPIVERADQRALSAALGQGQAPVPTRLTSEFEEDHIALLQWYAATPSERKGSGYRAE